MKVEDYVKKLEKAKQIILTGAPGTGKTFLAREIAKQMILGKDQKQRPQELSHALENQVGFVQFHPSYDYTDFVEGLRPIMLEDNVTTKTIGFERRDGIFKKFCKSAVQDLGNFDACYEKFVADVRKKAEEAEDDPMGFLSLETIRSRKPFRVSINSQKGVDFYTGDSTERSGSLKLDHLQELACSGNGPVHSMGYFKGVIEYLKKNYKLKTNTGGHNKKYVFIIDEINRGDIAKIFGELFFAIDDGYRGVNGRVKTQYQTLVEEGDVFHGGFYVPDNVYIIGTMNDIDRNVESMDFAIRRRFVWLEVKPADRVSDMLRDLVKGGLKKKAKACMSALNAVIKDELGAAYQIGPAYFRKLKDFSDVGSACFSELWENNLDPLLREYLRGNPQDVIEKKIGAFKVAYNNGLQSKDGEKPDDPSSSEEDESGSK